MNGPRVSRRALLLVAGAMLGCEGQQYVSPDRVALVVSEVSTGSELLSRCRYIPVLLGSRNRAGYDVDGQLQATIDITRDEVIVWFDGGEPVDAFRVESSRFAQVADVVDKAPPSGLRVELISPCTPDEP